MISSIFKLASCEECAMADLEAIMLFRDDRDYLWCLASECGLDFTGTRYTHITDAIEAARQAFPGCHS